MTRDNFRRLQAWKVRWRQAGKPKPDIRAHVEQADRGLVWPLQDGVLKYTLHDETAQKVLRQWEQ